MIPKVTPFDAYKSYLGLKNHFTKEKYDYHRYGGKSRASLESFYKRRDRYFFEKLSRQKDDAEVVEFLLAILSVVMIHSLFGLEKSSEMENKTIQTGRSDFSL